MKSTLLDNSHKKISRDTILFASLEELKTQVLDSRSDVTSKQIGDAFWDHVAKETMSSVILDHRQRYVCLYKVFVRLKFYDFPGLMQHPDAMVVV